METRENIKEVLRKIDPQPKIRPRPGENVEEDAPAASRRKTEENEEAAIYMERFGFPAPTASLMVTARKEIIATESVVTDTVQSQPAQVSNENQEMVTQVPGSQARTVAPMKRSSSVNAKTKPKPLV